MGKNMNKSVPHYVPQTKKMRCKLLIYNALYIKNAVGGGIEPPRGS